MSMPADSLLFVHLSDIHFTGQSGDTCFDLDADIRNELQRDARALIAQLGQVTGILVAGDIAFSGINPEYEKVGTWLNGFCSELQCPEESVWVVPGNHDVCRDTVKKSKITRDAHERLRARAASPESIDAEIRDYCCDPVAARALFDPLIDYNKFAARYQCNIGPTRPFWERDFQLQHGTTIRLRGLSSVLVSDEHDSKGNLFLGTAQATVRRDDSVEYIVLCHHPPDWLLDQDTVKDQLESKVRIQLFGHKHFQRLLTINDSVRLTAGAMHPERKDKNWEPTYNFLQCGHLDNGSFYVRIYSRQWHKQTCKFLTAPDPSTGNEYFEKTWQSAVKESRSTTQRVDLKQAQIPPEDLCAMPPIETNTTSTTSAKTQQDAVMEDHERRLTYLFLTLPFRHQMEIIQKLKLLTDEDSAMADSALFALAFARARDKQLLELLWSETAKRHELKTDENPFSGR